MEVPLRLFLAESVRGCGSETVMSSDGEARLFTEGEAANIDALLKNQRFESGGVAWKEGGKAKGGLVGSRQSLPG